MLFMSGTSVLISPFVGKWIDRSGETQPVLIGSCLMAAGAILLTLFLSMHRCCGKASSSLCSGSATASAMSPCRLPCLRQVRRTSSGRLRGFSNMPLSWLDLFVRHSGSVVWRRNNRGAFSGSGDGHDCGCHRQHFDELQIYQADEGLKNGARDAAPFLLSLEIGKAKRQKLTN